MFFVRLRSVVVILLLMLVVAGCLRVPSPAATTSSKSMVKAFAEFNLGEADASNFNSTTVDPAKLDSAKLAHSTRVANQSLPPKPQMPLNYAEKIVAEDVLVMAENSEEKPDPQQLNFWVPSVVNLRVAWPVDGGKTQAVFGLVVYRLSLC